METGHGTASAGGHRRRLLRLAVGLGLVLLVVALLWPRPAEDCSSWGRAADYQSTPATIGTGVTCLR